MKKTVTAHLKQATTVMTESDGGRYSCTECEGSGFAKDWKFCPFCGAEIVRFENRPERNPFDSLKLVETASVRVVGKTVRVKVVRL